MMLYYKVSGKSALPNGEKHPSGVHGAAALVPTRAAHYHDTIYSFSAYKPSRHGLKTHGKP